MSDTQQTIEDVRSIDVIVPLRNESRHVERLIEQLRSQSFPFARLFLVVAPSADRTRELCVEAASSDPRITVLDNPGGTAPNAMNEALPLVEADAWVRIDGHTEIPTDLLAVLRSELLRRDAACVGPVLKSGHATNLQMAIGEAMASPLGVGTARFRTGAGGSGYVDAVAFGMYRSDATKRIGLFNPDMTRNQDDEFNTRLRRSGGRIWLTTRTHVTYFPRSSMSALWKQYHEYGTWRAIGTILYRNELRWRQLAPASLVAAVSGCVIAAGRSRRVWPLLPVALTYSVVLAGQTKRTLAQGVPSSVAVQSAAAVAVMHTAYGTGFYRGVVRGLSRRYGRRLSSAPDRLADRDSRTSVVP